MSVTTEKSAGATAISPFHIEVPQNEIDELRRRAQATRWPDEETVSDRSPGVQLGKLRPLVEYWGSGYGWHKVEATLNALAQFITEIDGLNIQFAHIRSPHDDALPLLMTHGWPGSIIELLKVINPLTNPTAHGGRAEDAFHLVLPTMPGCGFSGKPASTGWGPARMASAFHELMLPLGYPRMSHRAATQARSSRSCWRSRAPRDSSASTSTCPGPCRRTSSDTSSTSTPRPRSCRIAKRSPTTGCCTSTATASGTRR
jgi:Epoxide hydrolase N terminus